MTTHLNNLVNKCLLSFENHLLFYHLATKCLILIKDKSYIFCFPRKGNLEIFIYIL